MATDTSPNDSTLDNRALQSITTKPRARKGKPTAIRLHGIVPCANCTHRTHYNARRAGEVTKGGTPEHAHGLSTRCAVHSLHKRQHKHERDMEPNHA